MTSIACRVAARYKSKKKLESGNTLYQYSERQVALRNSKKAERLEKLRKSVHKLRGQVKKDLDSGDPERVLTALAVGLMDHTAERVGNDESAEERGHFGVTGWQKGHVSFGKGKATIKYTGKSGVKQKKTVSDKALVTALRDAHAACEGDDLFCHDTVTVDAARVNAYLKKFEITAKDLRGLHANTVMQQELKAARSKGGKLPTDPKERKAQLKEEFNAALAATAEAVGHEPSTLKSQYLVPGVEDEFMKGRVMDKMVKSAAERYLRAFVRTLDEAWVEKLRKDLLTLMKNMPRITDYASAAIVRTACKTYRKNFDRWVFDEFLNKLKDEENFRFEGIRKPAWDFTTEIGSFPMRYPDEYWNEATCYAHFEKDKKNWEQRVKKKAQVLWKEFRQALNFQTTKNVHLELPDEDQLVLEGFQVKIVGYDPDERIWQDDALARFKESLRMYRRKAKALPWLLQKQLPLILTFNGKLDQGGVYHGSSITISMSALINQPPEWGAHMLAHEMGHHLYKSLDQSARIYWDAAIRQDYGPIDLPDLMRKWPENVRWTDDFAASLAEKDPILSLQVDVLARDRGGNAGWEKRDRFERALNEGETTVHVPKHPITGYAGKNTEESFCEAIGRLVGYGRRTVHDQVLAWLEVVIPGMIKSAAVVTQHVARRYLVEA